MPEGRAAGWPARGVRVGFVAGVLDDFGVFVGFVDVDFDLGVRVARADLGVFVTSTESDAGVVGARPPRGVGVPTGRSIVMVQPDSSTAIRNETKMVRLCVSLPRRVME
jgi:hypothetical protein